MSKYDPEISIRYGSRLPHWEKESAIYSITFRLGDSLPKSTLLALEEKREIFLQKMREQGKLNANDKKRFDKLFSEKIEQYLDAGYGECWMKQNNIAKIVADAIRHFEGKRYKLYAWCVMPNHVHVIVQPTSHTLSDVLHSWKSFAAHEANKLLHRTGTFWQAESFDHMIRDADKLERAIEYVWENPEKAGLKDWRWRWKINW